MKTSLFAIFILLGLFVNAQTDRVPIDCPYGTSPVLVFEINTFNFHKPRTDCQSRFGLCIRGELGMECQPVSMFRGNDFATRISGGKTIGWGEVKGYILELHIPLEIKLANNLSNDDVTQFTLESGSITLKYGAKTLKSIAGDYNVSVDQNDYVIFVNLED